MPYQIDLFAVLIFLGIVQGLFLCFFFFSKSNRQNLVNVWQGLMVVCMIACGLEIFLMYTGYIIHVLHLVDFSEVFALGIGPCFYLLVVTFIQGTVQRRHYLHFLFPAIFLLLQIPFLIQPEDVKFNAWVASYTLPVPYRTVTIDLDRRWFWFTRHHTEFVLLSLMFYVFLSGVEIVKVFRKKQENFFSATHPVLKSLRTGILEVAAVIVLIFVVKMLYPSDTGDHLISASIALVIYLMSFRVVSQSGFFKQATLHEPLKYKTSALNDDVQNNLLTKLQIVMANEKPYLNPEFSLPQLAQHLNASVHVVSQAINTGLKKNFFEMVADWRVEEAKRLLRESPNVKIEEIAFQVGYLSKSSFNTAFRKLVGMTPSEFRSKVS